MKLATILVASALASGLVGLAACTTTTTTTTSSAADASAPKGDGGKEGGSSGSSGSTSGGEEEDAGEPSGGDSCGDTTSQQACVECCAGEHQQGFAVYQGAQIQCFCEAANCATECADTICASTPKNPTAECQTCAEGKLDSCIEAVSTACQASQDCVAFNNCAVQAKCGSKK